MHCYETVSYWIQSNQVVNKRKYYQVDYCNENKTNYFNSR